MKNVIILLLLVSSPLFAAKKKLLSSEVEASKIAAEMTKQNLVLEIRSAWNMVVYYNGLPIDEFQNYSFSRSKGYVNVLELNNTIYYTVLGYIFMIQADNDSCQVTEVWKSDYRIWDFKKDKYGNVYLATNKGVCKFENGNWNNENWISDNISISNIHFDRKGGLWMASLYKGLFYSCNSHVKCVFSPSNASINEIHGTRRDVFYSNDNSEVYETFSQMADESQFAEF